MTLAHSPWMRRAPSLRRSIDARSPSSRGYDGSGSAITSAVTGSSPASGAYSQLPHPHSRRPPGGTGIVKPQFSQWMGVIRWDSEFLPRLFQSLYLSFDEDRGVTVA